jgi:glyoxylase-like metal-dependent hydrolase (beta-lactamase superfamily II)
MTILGPDVTVEAILDAETDHPDRLQDAFPGTPAAGWARVRADYPATVGADGRWRLPVHCYLIRAYGTTVLVDCGVGPAGTPAAAWLGVTGTLPERVGDVDVVVFTHLHSDHIGWAVDPEWLGGARFVMGEGEPVPPSMAAVPLETAAPGELLPGVELVALPGHTPGHQGVLVHGPDGDVLLAGDAFNHPLQRSDPDVPSGADADPAHAARTRRDVLERLTAVPRIAVASAHFPDGWW